MEKRRIVAKTFPMGAQFSRNRVGATPRPRTTSPSASIVEGKRKTIPGARPPPLPLTRSVLQGAHGNCDSPPPSQPERALTGVTSPPTRAFHKGVRAHSMPAIGEMGSLRKGYDDKEADQAIRALLLSYCGGDLRVAERLLADADGDLHDLIAGSIALPPQHREEHGC